MSSSAREHVNQVEDRAEVGSAAAARRSRDPVWVLWGAVRSALAVLGDGIGRGGADPAPPQPARIEQYLVTVLDACAGPHGHGHGLSSEVLAALRSACAHLRAQELADAYLALHTAHGELSSVLRQGPRSPGPSG